MSKINVDDSLSTVLIAPFRLKLDLISDQIHTTAMKTRCLVLAAMTLFLLAGCATDEIEYSTLHSGMSRDYLRSYFGGPLRIEPGASGGENWYYRFSSVQAQPTGASGTSEEFGQQNSYVSAGLEFSKRVVELPVHISSEGFVMAPVPKGKVVKN